MNTPSVSVSGSVKGSVRLDPLCALEFFTVCTKLAEMAILYSKNLTTAKVTLVGLDLMLKIEKCITKRTHYHYKLCMWSIGTIICAES